MGGEFHGAGVGVLDEKWRSSGGDGQRVEVRRVEDTIQVRDSRDPDGAVLTFTFAEWLAFTGGAKDGEFDV